LIPGTLKEDHGIDLLFGNIEASGIPRGGEGVWGVKTPPPPEILMALQNRAKLTPM